MPERWSKAMPCAQRGRITEASRSPFSRLLSSEPIDATQRAAYNYRSFSTLFPFPNFRSFTLANIKSAKKRARQAVKRNARNSSARSMLRTSIKKVVNAIAAKDKVGAEAAYKAAEPVMDRYASRGLIHKNKASRHKSRLSAHIKALA